MYTLSCAPSVFLYVSENKTLAGKEDRSYEGEALGRKLAVTSFHQDPHGKVHRVNQESLALKPELLSVAELLQATGFAAPPDPDRSAAATELLLEAHFENLEILRFECFVDEQADEVHVYSLGEPVLAETALTLELPPAQRTKMALARCLQRNEALAAEETLERAWSSTLAQLQPRAAAFLPAPPGPAAPLVPAAKAAAAPADPPAPEPAPLAAGRGRGRGRGKGRGRGRGRG